MQKYLIRVSLLLLCIIVVACNPSEEEEDPTPNQAVSDALLASESTPTPSPQPDTSPTPDPEYLADISRTASLMADAVLTGNAEAYLSHVWQENPIFFAEHTAWAENIVDPPPVRFELRINPERVTTHSDTRVSARMTMAWRTAEEPETVRRPGTTLTVQFLRSSPDERWYYGGEYWNTISLHSDGVEWEVVADEATGTDMPEIFRLHYFPDHFDPEVVSPTQRGVQLMAGYLPDVHATVGREIDCDPAGVTHIKMYNTVDELSAMTLINYPGTIISWYQPAQAMKVALRSNTELPPTEEVFLIELTRLCLIQMADNRPENYPWWVLEGFAAHVRQNNYFRLAQSNELLLEVAQRAQFGFSSEEAIQAGVAEGLFQWDLLEDETMIPRPLHGIAILQSQVLIYYINETYSTNARNEWINAIADGTSVDEASQQSLGISFEQLSADWVNWLLSQLPD
jgi:hypothetical protein